MVLQNALAATCAPKTGIAALLVCELMRARALDDVWTNADNAAAGTEILTPIR